MDDSWQKLMGLDCGSQEGPSSPIFHKKKWVVMPTALKRSGSVPFLNKFSEKKLKKKRKDDSNNSLQILDLNRIMPSGEKNLKITTVEKDEPLLIYNTTPTKNYKQKRKTIDLLSCSLKSEGNSCKKFKLDNDNTELSQRPPNIKSEQNSVSVSSPNSNECRISQKNNELKPQRNLLYSCNEKNDISAKTQTPTVNDILKSVIMIDEADSHLSLKKNCHSRLDVESSDFQSVTSLSRGNEKNPSKGTTSPPSSSPLENCNNSFGNFVFTEIENGFLKSNHEEESNVVNNSSFPVDEMPLDETLNNYRFTEIEENSHWSHQKEKNLVASSTKLTVSEFGSTYPNPHESHGRNTSLTSQNKNGPSSDETICRGFEVLNKTVEPRTYPSLVTEKDFEGGKEVKNASFKSCRDEKDIFNSTLSPQRLVHNLDKENFLSTSKDCFEDLDAISTEDFRNNQFNEMNNHHEWNESLKEDMINQSLEDPDRSMLNKSASKLNVTLTDIMQNLLKKSVSNDSNSNLNNKTLCKNFSNLRNSSFGCLSPQITAKEEIGNHECIPAPSGLLNYSETVFLTQEYLEEVKPEVSVDSTVFYYQQSFDEMISAEVKSRLQDNCVTPPVDQKPLLLDQSFSSDIVQVDDKSPDNAFIITNHKGRGSDFNDTDLIPVINDLNESFITLENSPTNNLNNDVEIKFSQHEHVSTNPLVTCSPKVFEKVVDNNFMSQACLMQFNNSFQFGSEGIVSQMKETNVNNRKAEENNVNISIECLTKKKQESKKILNEITSSTQHNNTVSYEEKKVLENKNNIKVAIVNENELTNMQKINKPYKPISICSTNIENVDISLKSHYIQLGMQNSSNGGVLNDGMKTIQQEQPVLFKVPSSPVSCQKSNRNNYFKTALGKNINISNESLKKIKNIFKDDLVVTDQENVWKCLTDFTSLTSNVYKDKCDLEKKNSSEIQSSFKSMDKNIDISESFSNNFYKSELKSYSISDDKVNNLKFSRTSNEIGVSENSCVKMKSSYEESLENESTKTNDRGNDNSLVSNGRDKNVSLHILRENEKFMFSTAGGKNIKVSDVALAQIKSKFNDIIDSHEIEEMNDKSQLKIDQKSKTQSPNSSKADNFMFSSSSDKKFTALEEDDLLEIELKSNSIFERNPAADIEEKTTINFKTSSPKTIQATSFKSACDIKKDHNVPEDAKDSFTDVSKSNSTKIKNTKFETNFNQGHKPSITISNKSESFLFSTAGGKNIRVSDVALSEVQSKFNEIMKTHEPDIDQGPKITLPKSNKNDNFMFSKASGKNIEVCNDALDKVKSKFNEIFDNSFVDLNNTKTETLINQATKKAMPNPSKYDSLLLSSASGKNIVVSEEALAIVKSKFSEMLDTSCTNLNIPDSEKHINQATKMTVSDPIKNDNLLLSGSSGETITSFPSTSKNDSYMFSSAYGKSIEKSNVSLSEGKTHFYEFRETDITENKPSVNTQQIYKTLLPSCTNVSNFQFSTAGGKNVKVSDSALAKVKSKFNEILESQFTEDKTFKDLSDKIQTSKTLLASSSESKTFMFSSANGKNINISEDALVKVCSQLNEIAISQFKEDKTDNPEDPLDENKALRTFLPFSGVSKPMFSSASGKNVNVSEDSLAKIKSKFSDIFENSLTEVMKSESETNFNPPSKSLANPYNKKDNFKFSNIVSNNIKASNIALSDKSNKDIEMYQCQSLETSFSCFDKGDSFISPVKDSKDIEISDELLEEMQFKLKDISNDDPNKVELKKTKKVSSDKTECSSSKIHKNDHVITFSVDLNTNDNVCDKLIHQNSIESFPSYHKINVIESENCLCKSQGITFSTARGKQINVSEDALAKVKSKFSEVIDDISGDPFQSNKCINPSSEKENEINNFLSSIPLLKNQTPTSSHTSSKINKLFDKNDKKSKSTHSENSTIDQPSAKKLCSHLEMFSSTQKLPPNMRQQNIFDSSKVSHLTFTQSISQALLDKEIDMIEKKKCSRKIIDENDSESNKNLSECLETQRLQSSKSYSQFSSEETDLTMIYEVSDSAAAFMADCTPERSVLSSPSSFFSRKSMEPIKMLEMEFDDVDDEIMVAAEVKVTPKSSIQNNYSADNSINSNKSKSCSVEILSIRNDQRKKADEKIIHKLKNRPPASPGFYMTLRNQGTLKKLCENLWPLIDKSQIRLEEEVLNINSSNAALYEFSAESFFSYNQCFSAEGIINLGYGFSLIISDVNKIGLSEISRCFLCHPNVDPSLVSPDWIKNHFKWIVWKLACYERIFSNNEPMKYLTPKNVLHQLKYRYDREIDLAQRPALKKIVECDEPSSRRMIACVADIKNVDLSDDESSYEIELTDGWYSIWACIDPAMKNLIDRQKVKIGTKLVIHSAELLNNSEGCDPLEIPTHIRLKLHTNCVRRVKWYTKLGFTRHPGPIRVPLSSIFPNGGLIGLTSAIIARVYPLLYMSKDASGKTVFRNAYAEHHASKLKENDLTLKSEELFEKLFPEIESKYKSGVVKYDKNMVKKIKDPELLWKIVSSESDPTEVQSLMTPDQVLEVQKYHEKISSKIREEVQAIVKKKLEELIPSQKTKCLLKLRLVDPGGDFNALLTVWNASEDLLKILVEKKLFDFYTLNATGIRDKILQLSSTNRSIYRENNLLSASKEFERKVTPISDIVVNSVSPHFGEIDVVGIVIYVKEPEKPWGVTNVYLSDNQENFLMITFWTSLKTLGCDDTLKPGSIVACINLQWRQGSGSYVIPSTYANEMTYFSANPSPEYLVKAFQEIKSAVNAKGLENFITERRRRLFTILKEREYSSKAPVPRVETPKVLKRLENLKKYGEASPLPKLSLLSSPDIHRNFRSPKSGGS